MFTYSLFLLVSFYKLYNKYLFGILFKFILFVLFILNQIIFVTNAKEITLNHNESIEIVSLVGSVNNDTTIIIEDFDTKNYFRRYSNKFSTLINMIVYNSPSFEKPKVILSSQIKNELNKKNFVVLSINNNFTVKKQLSKFLINNYDKNSIKILNNSFGYNYNSNRMELKKIHLK
jgi:hypothetical protein